MAEVVRLKPAADPTEHQTEMIELLEAICAEIKAGKTVSLAVATVNADETCVTRWMAKGHFLSTLGAVSRLATDMGTL